MTANNGVPLVRFAEFLKPNKRPHTLGPTEDANLVGMRLYGHGPFHRELKLASKIRKKSHFVIQENDVIYNKLFAWKGTFGIVSAELDGMFVSDKFPTYELDEAKVDRNYLQWYFRYPPLWEQARQMSTGSAALSKLTLNPPRFVDLTIPLVSLSEQRRIAAKVQRLAVKIDEARSIQTNLRDGQRSLWSAYLREMSQRFPHDGTLDRVLRCKPRNGWSAKCDNAEDGVAVLTLAAVTGFDFVPSAHKRTSLPTYSDAHYWLRHGDLLMTRSNTPQLVGHAAIYNGMPTPCIYPDLMMRLDVDESVADRTFVWRWLQTPVVRDYVEHNAKGTSPTMKKISQPIVMKIPFPKEIKVAEQRRIVAYLDGLQAKVDELKRLQALAAAELDALLPAILDRAFKGEL
jgi:type I restriction enzyme S subunit